jgi:transketolase
MNERDRLAVNTLRFLSVDMVEKAKSGHPGLPLGAAPMAYAVWTRFLKHNPRNPEWPDRDRFLLSAGHGSALLYALLHLTGYDLPMSELERFRQWDSRTPGHPESERTAGVEATTGPLGQGFAMGVGMAIAERFLAHTFNRDGFPVFDHRVYAICSDGDLMEGISGEAASMAGTMGLGKLVYLYDQNSVSLEGGTDLAFTEDVATRFRGYGWQVQHVEDGNDLDAIVRAIETARGQTDRPNLLVVRTHIGYGSPKQDTKDAHGEPLGAEATRATKEKLGWPLEPAFLVPDQARALFSEAIERGREAEKRWRDRYEEYRRAYPDLARTLDRALARELPPDWAEGLPTFGPKDGGVATRDAGSKALAALAARVPTLIGGAADLAPSTKTLLPGGGDFIGRKTGRNLHYGVREHAMAAAVNGMAMHGGVIPYGATFLVFSDYCRPALRIGALMRAPGIFVFTHDSIGLGEDGPTHQPVEHLWSLRAIPGFTVLRPADANETVAAWRVALRRRGPVAFALTRQKLPVLDADPRAVGEGVERGAYVLSETGPGPPDVILLATGSEVSLALEAAKRLAAGESVRVRVVSMPSTELFDEQSAEYRARVLPPNVPVVAVEAGSPLGWWKYVGPNGAVVGLDRFGASAPGPTVMEHLGFTPERVVERARGLLARRRDATEPLAR